MTLWGTMLPTAFAGGDHDYRYPSAQNIIIVEATSFGCRASRMKRT
jgi:hypothetical protein